MTQTMTDAKQACQLQLNGQSVDLPLVIGTEQEVGIDISKLRDQTGAITLDSGFGNTGSCSSQITFIDGEKGILRYRGIPIEQLAEHSSFVETAYLVIYGELPNAQQLEAFSQRFTNAELLHEDLKYHFEGFPSHAHPMAILSAMINATGCFEPKLMNLETDADFDAAAAKLISKVRTIAAFSYRKSKGLPAIYPKPHLRYAENFLHMMFSLPYQDIEIDPDLAQALNLILILHADHEQNCSTSTVRMVGSSKANLFASIAAGVCALWGPLHGGANMEVINMLEQIQASKIDPKDYIAQVKDKKSTIRLMGFGHRVYKSFDPRSRILKEAADKVLKKLKVSDEALDIAKHLEEVALSDEYFISRNLYPNVDFYSGTILRAMGIPLEMFTVMFAIGRMPGWIAHWKEVHDDPKGRIYRPRQIYTGYTERAYVPVGERS